KMPEALKVFQDEKVKLLEKYKEKPAALALLVRDALLRYAAGPRATILAGELLTEGKADTFDEVAMVLRLARRAKQLSKGDSWKNKAAQRALKADLQVFEARTAPERARPWAKEKNDVASGLAAKGLKAMFETDEPWDKTAQDSLDKALA